MLPFARMLAPPAGATFLGAVGAPRANRPASLRSIGVRAGHFGLLFAEHGWNPSSGWTTVTNISDQRLITVFSKILTSADLDYTGPTNNDFSILCYADVRSAAYVTPAGFTKAPGHAGVVGFNTQVAGMSYRTGNGNFSQSGDPRPAYSLYDLVLPKLPYANGTAFSVTASNVAAIELRA